MMHWLSKKQILIAMITDVHNFYVYWSIISNKPQYLYLCITLIMQDLKLLFNANINHHVPENHTIKPIYILFCYEGSVMPGRPLNITTLFLFCLMHHHRIRHSKCF